MNQIDVSPCKGEVQGKGGTVYTMYGYTTTSTLSVAAVPYAGPLDKYTAVGLVPLLLRFRIDNSTDWGHPTPPWLYECASLRKSVNAPVTGGDAQSYLSVEFRMVLPLAMIMELLYQPSNGLVPRYTEFMERVLRHCVSELGDGLYSIGALNFHKCANALLDQLAKAYGDSMDAALGVLSQYPMVQSRGASWSLPDSTTWHPSEGFKLMPKKATTEKINLG